MTVGRFEPTSKVCSTCGHRNNSLTLSDREWACPECGSSHDRDANAAMNIKQIGLQTVTPRVPGEVPVDPSQREGMKQEATDQGQ